MLGPPPCLILTFAGEISPPLLIFRCPPEGRALSIFLSVFPFTQRSIQKMCVSGSGVRQLVRQIFCSGRLSSGEEREAQSLQRLPQSGRLTHSSGHVLSSVNSALGVIFDSWKKKSRFFSKFGFFIFEKYCQGTTLHEKCSKATSDFQVCIEISLKQIHTVYKIFL